MRRGTRWTLAAAVAFVVAAVQPGSSVGRPERQVIVVIRPGVAYQDALRMDVWRSLAGTGGIGLLAGGDAAATPSSAAASIGAGRPVDDLRTGVITFRQSDRGVLVETEAFPSQEGATELGLLGTVLAEAGLAVGYVDPRGARGDPAMLVAMDVAGEIPFASLNAFPTLADLPPEFIESAVTPVTHEADVIVSPSFDVLPLAFRASGAAEMMVIAVALAPTAEMRERGDLVTPIVVGRGKPGLFTVDAWLELGLTSSTTRRDGVVSIVDVAPTVLDFLGVPVPDSMPGSPIEPDGERPTELHRRYLDWRKVVGPLGLGVLGLALASLVVGLGVIFGRWSGRVARLPALAGLVSVALLVVLVPASLLPTFSWPVVLGALALGGGALTAVALRVGRGNPTTSVAAVASAGLVLVAIDVASGWPTGTTPLLGGSALDGERFFGLGNAAAGIVLSGSVLAAARLSLRSGSVLLGAAALFAGLPFLGADVGGCITLAIAAGLWYGLGRWDTLGWRPWVVAAGAAVAALVGVIVSHRLLPPGGTHVAGAVAAGPFGAIEVFWNRLLLNLEATSATPAAWLAVLGLPVWLVVALRRPRGLRPAMDADPAWWRAIVVLSLGGMAGYVLNDTYGMAGIAFVFVSAAIVYPTLRARATEPAPRTAPAAG